MKRALLALVLAFGCAAPALADPGATTCLTAPLTVTSGSAYSANNEVGGLISFTLPGNYTSGLLQGVQVNVKSSQSNAYKLYLFTSNPSNSTWTDKVSPAINAADTLKPIGPFNIAAYDNGLGTQTAYVLGGISTPFTSATSTLYGVLVTTSAVTYTSTSDVQVQACVLPG